jgi:hypothetical protein
MKKILIIVFTLIYVFNSDINAQNSPSSDLLAFDNAVRNSRVEMRKYCALVQQLMKENDDTKKNEAVTHITNSINLWNDAKKFTDNVPAEYSDENQFSEKLTQINSTLDEMKSKLVDNQFKESFKACAAACGLFVKLHEENNLDYALDKLFHLRKAVKKLQNDLTEDNKEVVANDINSMLQKRNKVITVKLILSPSLSNEKEYNNYIMEISSMIDELSFSYFNKKKIQLDNKLADLLAVINKAYSLAL